MSQSYPVFRWHACALAGFGLGGQPCALRHLGRWGRLELQHLAALLYSALFVIISGCAATSTPSALVPVASSCLPAQVPSMPLVRPDSELLALDDRQLVLTIASERLELISFSRQAEALLQACR